jgi:hypothetical protein
VSNLDDVTGILANKFLIYVAEPEGTQARDGQLYQKMNKLKSKITDDQIQINEKHLPTYQTTNYLHWIFTGNHPESLRLEPTDRRFAIFLASSVHRGDTDYFNRLTSTFTNEVGNHLYSFLLQLPITVNLTTLLKTEVRQDIKDMAVPGPVRFWREWTSGSWVLDNKKHKIIITKYPDPGNPNNVLVPKLIILSIYNNAWCAETKDQTYNDSWFTRLLKSNGIVPVEKRHNNERCWVLPSNLVKNDIETLFDVDPKRTLSDAVIEIQNMEKKAGLSGGMLSF